MNVYDQQLAADGRILHRLGLMLQRDAHAVARPVAAARPTVSLFFAEVKNSRPDSSSVEFTQPTAPAQMGGSTHGENTPLHRCAWCDSEAGVAIKPGGALVSHGICARHLAGIKSNLEELRRMAA